jgi:hypothetical protein
MIKDNLVSAYKEVKQINGLTYTKLVEHSGLTRSQLHMVLKLDGRGVSIEAMEAGLLLMGFSTSVDYYNCEEE